MTEKRFTTDNGSHEDVCLVDNLTKKEYESNFEDMVSLMNDIWNQTQRFEKHNQRLEKENKKLKSENKRLTDKLNRTALELVDGVISQGKATEISEMSYREFLDYRAKNGKPMELKK